MSNFNKAFSVCLKAKNYMVEYQPASRIGKRKASVARLPVA